MKIIHYLIFLILFTDFNSSYAQTTFQKVFGVNGFTTGTGVQQTADSGYVFTGFVDNSISTGSDAILIKTDYKGDTLWTKVFGGTSDDGGRAVQQTTDGGYIVTGFSSSFNEDVYLVKTDSVGNIQWSKTYGGPDTQEGESVIQTADGGYLISAGDFNQYLKVFLIKTNAIGDTLWTRTVDAPGTFSRVYSVKQTNDGGFVFTGYFLNGTYDNFYLVKLNANGSTTWSRTYITGFDTEAHSVIQTTDEGFVLVGTSKETGTDNAFLLKTDSTGNFMWNRTYGYIGDENAYDVAQTAGGGYIIAGQTNSFGAGDVDAYLIKTDEVGLVTWSSTYGGANYDAARCVAITNDGGYIINGFKTDPSGNYFEGYMIKTDANGNSGCNQIPVSTTSGTLNVTVGNAFDLISAGCTVTDVSSDYVQTTVFGTLCASVGVEEFSDVMSGITIIPNPVKDVCHIEGTTINGTIIIADMSGKEILRQKTDAGATTISVETLTKGVYLLTYTNGEDLLRKKLLSNKFRKLFRY